MKGKFIVIEGIDGCGKTTQIDELSKWLPYSGLIKKGSKLQELLLLYIEEAPLHNKSYHKQQPLLVSVQLSRVSNFA